MAGVALSKTQTMRGIRSGELTGYDDVRLGTIAALRRRGFVSEAIRQLILDLGPTLVDSSLSWETLYAYNRKFADERANRYFFVSNPVKMLVHKAPDLRQVRLRLHPGHPEHGSGSCRSRARAIHSCFISPVKTLRPCGRGKLSA